MKNTYRGKRTASYGTTLVVMIMIMCLKVPAHAQFDADTRDEVAIGLRLDAVRTSIQKAKPDHMNWEQQGPILVDGVEKDETGLRADILAAVAAADYRSSIHPRLGGPYAGVFGPFEDFTLDAAAPVIVGDSCFISCTFRLHITGDKSSPGMIKFYHDVFTNWRIVSIDGMMSLLNGEAQTGKRMVKPQVVPKKRR